MPTFIDESGDLGWADGPHGRSSTHFRLIALRLPTKAEANACRDTIRGLRTALKLPPSFLEFHYSDLGRHPELMAAFFDAVLPHEFGYVLVNYDKRPNWSSRPHRRAVYYSCGIFLATTLRPQYVLAEGRLPPDRRGRPARLAEEVIVDDNKDPVFLEQLAHAFLPLGTHDDGTRKPVKLLGPAPWFADSAHDELLQLADMLCGATCDYLEGDGRWHSMARRKCLEIIDLP